MRKKIVDGEREKERRRIVGSKDNV